MNYLDVRMIGQDIEKYFQKFQRTCETHLGITTKDVLALNMVVFGQYDLEEMARICLRYNVVILSWSTHYPMPYSQTLIVSLSLSEVQKNGHTD